jgi:hypothetical protein
MIARWSCNADVLKINAVLLVEVRAKTRKDFNIVVSGNGGDS